MVSNSADKVAIIEEIKQNIKLLNNSQSILNHCVQMFEKNAEEMEQNILSVDEFEKKLEIIDSFVEDSIDLLNKIVN